MGRRKGTSAFPVARIKKMMQADEDIGKIATATPVLVAKALECMMDSVVRGAADIARERGARTVTPQHLKMCVEDNENFDFLRHVLKSVHVDPNQDKVKRANSSDLQKQSSYQTVKKRPRSPINACDKPKRRGRGRPRAVDKEKEKEKEDKLEPMEIDDQPDQHEAVTPPVPLPEIKVGNAPTKDEDDDDEDYDDDDDDDDQPKEEEKKVIRNDEQPPAKELKVEHVISKEVKNNDSVNGSDEADDSDPVTQKDTDDSHTADRVSVHALLS